MSSASEEVYRTTRRNLFTRDFILGILTFFAYMFACFMLIPTLPVYFVRLGSHEGEVGVLVGIFSVSSLVFRPLVGGALSRYSEKSLMISAALLFAVTFPALVFFHPFWPSFAVRFFQGVAYACLDTAAFALVIKVTPPVYRGRALSYFMLAPSLATFMAPSLGMAIVNRYDFTILFLFCMIVTLCALLFSIILKGPKTDGSDTDTVAPRNAFFLERKIIAPATSTLLFNFVLGSFTAFFPLYAIQCGMKNPGYFFSVAAVMTITGRILGGKIIDVWGKEKVILTFISTSMISMILLFFSSTLPMFLLVGLIWGVGVAFILPVSMAYALDYAGSSSGTAIGTFRAFTDFGFAVGPMIIGTTIPVTGYRGMFLSLAVICLINLCYFHFYVKKKYRETSTG